MSCVELSVNISGSGQFGNFSIYGNLKYFPAANKTGIIQVSNVSSISYDTGNSGQMICTIPQNDCYSNISMPYNFTSENEYFETGMAMDGLNKVFWRGYLDEGSFSGNNGFVYTPNSTCMLWKNPSLGEHNECCVAFAPAIQAQTTYPKCKAFRSRFSILNTDDNFSIFATVTMNYTVNGNLVTGSGNYSGPSNTTIFYRLTDFMMSKSADGLTLTGNATLKDGDAKFFAFALISPSDNGYLTVGRFIRRGDQTLMSEGKPFTPQNNCDYFNEQFSPNQVSSSQFCCQTFESN
uniref:Uncharacterized protein n=1 Tax=Panagrolaimus sp. PS1159 TaxID=55785 RepID=A0AC35FJM1_9BILA